jgi:hypothetical protein
MSTNTYSPAEKAVLDAAQKLLDKRNREIEAAQSAQRLRQALQNLLAEQQQLETNTVHTERALALKQLDATSTTLRDSEIRRRELLPKVSEARSNLWAVCYSGDKALILRTAREFGDSLTSYLLHCNQVDQNRRSYEMVNSHCQEINQAFGEVFARLEYVKRQIITANAALARMGTAPIVQDQDDLAREVINAAALLCGTENIYFTVPSSKDWQRMFEAKQSYRITYVSGEAAREDFVVFDNDHANSDLSVSRNPGWN